MQKPEAEQDADCLFGIPILASDVMLASMKVTVE